VKANPHVEIIKTFMKLGTNFDVASAAEMDLVLSVGASPDRILFAHPVKSIDDIIRAKRRRVTFMVFDNEPELYKLPNIVRTPKFSSELKLKISAA